MLELITRFAKAAPEPFLIKMVEEALANYKANKTEENKRLLAMKMDMLSIQLLSVGISTEELVAKSSQISEIYDFVTQKKGKQ